MVATKKKSMAQGNKATLLHEKRSTTKKRANPPIGKTERLRGTSAAQARLTLLEDVLIVQAKNPTTAFDELKTISNPGTVVPQGNKVLQVWWETYRTTEVTAVANILRLEQEVIIGTNIISSFSTESQARQECYGLAEELEERFVGFMPQLGDSVEVIFPMHDVDASFVQMEQEGVFTLNIMWSFTWVVAKGAKP